jgi:hypothetical protein
MLGAQRKPALSHTRRLIETAGGMDQPNRYPEPRIVRIIERSPATSIFLRKRSDVHVD